MKIFMLSCMEAKQSGMAVQILEQKFVCSSVKMMKEKPDISTYMQLRIDKHA